MIVAGRTIDRFISSLRIFGTLVAGAVLIAGVTTTLSGLRFAASCAIGAGAPAIATQHQGP